MTETNTPGKLRFYGSEVAELFTLELQESLSGVLAKNFISNPEDDNVGFVSASVDGRPWTGTMWTRDAGVFLRELVHYGYLEKACLVAACLIRMVRVGDDGYYTFPERFDLGQPASGSELDGTAAIVIGMVLLWQRLPESHPSKERIYSFLHRPDSALFYIDKVLKSSPLIPGSGEFGGGMSAHGLYMNVVQNNLVCYALLAASEMEKTAGDQQTAALHTSNAQMLSENIDKYLVDQDGSWIWCIDPATLKPDAEILNHPINKGFGGINGPACMSCDVLGFESLAAGYRITGMCIKTFEKLYSFPVRKQQFEKYGLWSQFDLWAHGMLTGPSYGQGYALQTMLLLDNMEMADRALAYLVKATYQPPDAFPIDRESPYWLYERYLSPDAAGIWEWDQGCGALNLVCVAEPLKIGRLILGVDDTKPDSVTFIPRVPPSWQGFEAENWLIRIGTETVRVDISYTREKFKLKVLDGKRIERLVLKLGTAENRTAYELLNVSVVEEVSN
jgi:hypothetical protein